MPVVRCRRIRARVPDPALARISHRAVCRECQIDDEPQDFRLPHEYTLYRGKPIAALASSRLASLALPSAHRMTMAKLIEFGSPERREARREDAITRDPGEKCGLGPDYS